MQYKKQRWENVAFFCSDLRLSLLLLTTLPTVKLLDSCHGNFGTAGTKILYTFIINSVEA